MLCCLRTPSYSHTLLLCVMIFVLHCLNYYSTSLLATFYFFQADMLQLNTDGERPQFIKICSYGRHFVYLCFINPSGDHIATLNANGLINIWAVSSGNLVSMKLFFLKFSDWIWISYVNYTTQLSKMNIVKSQEWLKLGGPDQISVSA
jgi:WD40 repeat protein